MGEVQGRMGGVGLLFQRWGSLIIFLIQVFANADWRASGDAKAGGLTRSRLVADRDFDIVTELQQEMHQALDGEGGQLALFQRRDLWLVDSEEGCGLALREPASLDFRDDLCGQLGFRQQMVRFGQPEVDEDVSATCDVLPSRHFQSPFRPASLRASRSRRRIKSNSR